MAALEQTETPAHNPNDHRKRTILVVEDEAIVAEDVRASLEEAGYRVPAIAANRATALENVARERPDLILLDIMLAGGDDGIGVAEEIHAHDDVPVVYLTAYSDDALVRRAAATGPYGYLLKPFNDRELHATVETALHHHQMEEALRRNEAQFRQLFEDAPLPYHSLDEEGRILAVNQAWLDTLGYEREEVLGRPVADFIVPDDLPILADRFPRFKSEGRVCDVEYRLRRHDGRPVAICLSGVIAKDVEGHFRRTHCIFQDITERKRREEAAVKQRNLESLGLLAGGIAHDFNNLLTGITGNVELAETLLHEDGDQAADCLAAAREIALRTRELTRELLTFSSGGAPTRSVDSVAPLLHEASTFVVAGGRIECTVRIDDDLWPAYFDAEQINQVVYNLLINAVEAMDGAGTITLGADNFTVEEASPLPLAPGRYVRITIADTGRGIPPDRLVKIFDPYYTDKEMGEADGGGLGLAVCHSVLQRHGGYIDVESEVGVGTAFHLYIPVAPPEGDAHLPAPTTARKAPAPTGRGRILVMDDEEMVRDISHEMLTHAGHRVEVVCDGGEALARYKQTRTAGDPFDLVILDLSIRGGMGGEETIKRLREVDPQVRAVVMSGYSNDPIMADCARYGFEAALAKPFTMATLRATVETLLSGTP